MGRADGLTAQRLLLVVEDSEEDREAIDRALSRSHPELLLEFLPDGGDLLARLRDASRSRPDLILLDLNMPGVDGYRLLADVRADPELASLTVVVFTSSTASADIDRCYAAGADSYVYKPVNFSLFRTVLQGAVDYWQDNPR
ncbi:response regulator [Actinosynnema pretiosum subsp. pretiosum]|uniref:Response regulator n=1 Tax=Actinosynnema pretiosum subsp. pretiosum TaxID=103721 RepID=A0AA45L9I0_9PSEU|nr:Two-component response regulator [Actinosynnema pretiosum subsp. pretiosum]QUF05543.1 response regulator [Actinosynnema pretiosum subsp. pretiosum]